MRRRGDSYGIIAILLHWIIAALFLCQIALGFVMTRPSADPAVQFSMFQWHKSFGLLTLLLAAVRLGHSALLVTVKPPPGVGVREHLAARGMHSLLLALTLLVPLAGWMIASVSTLAIPTYAFNLFLVPHLPVTKSDLAESWWTEAHAVLAYLGLALVALHSGAALYHHHVRRDGVLLHILGIRRTRTDVIREETK